MKPLTSQDNSNKHLPEKEEFGRLIYGKELNVGFEKTGLAIYPSRVYNKGVMVIGGDRVE